MTHIVDLAKPGDPLSDRELQVLHGLAEGLSNADIGASLFLAENTIKTYARCIYRKFGIDGTSCRAAARAQAVAVGFRKGLIT